MSVPPVARKGLYAAYGEPAGNDFSGSRFRYTGQIALPEVKLYHYKARVYDPTFGRFLQTDPIGYKDDLNLYAYVLNDPANLTDPTGTSCTTTTNKAGHMQAVSCKIDRGRNALVKKFGEQAVAELENSYKEAVNTLLARGDYKDRIDIDAVDPETQMATGEHASAKVTASEVAKSLINRTVGYDPSSNFIMQTSSQNENRMDMGGTIGKIMRGSIFGPEIFYRGNLQQQQIKAWTHEGMHIKRVHDQLGPRSTWERNHNTPFNQTAARLLDQ